MNDPRPQDRPRLRVHARVARGGVPAWVWCAVSIGFLDYRKLARALAADLRLGLIAADRQQRIAEHGPPDGAGSNPIEVLRAACEKIKRSSGDRRPRSIMLHQTVYERYREWYIENIARAERLLGIGCVAQGAFPTGWPWTKRAGRMSQEEKQLRESLPRWRSALANLPPSKPIEASNGGLLLLGSADDIGERLAVLLAGDRGGGKTDQMMAVLYRHPDGQEITRMSQIIAPINPNVPAGYVMPSMIINSWMRTGNRRPTGKRAQRARNKPWNQ